MAAMDKAQAQTNRRADAHQLDGIPGGDGGQEREDFAAKLREKVKARVDRNRNRSRAVYSRN
jgi:hypothetical protein